MTDWAKLEMHRINHMTTEYHKFLESHNGDWTLDQFMKALNRRIKIVQSELGIEDSALDKNPEQYKRMED